ncbi:uncharacterized protein LOC116432101 [Nomia melanderi]|uniref:uncharacterized protein LOC116432101 n=1 Tax=Nomia melanderi TaxID=2448451 RepID=UPI0013046D43|nr:uncharacterized protein LOC116432101 [Nomia melanderi]
MNNYNLSDASHSETASKPENAVHKRRSSVFQSRLTAFDQCEGNENRADNSDADRCISETSQAETFNLEQYICSLKNERKEWIETFRQRKTERKCLTKKKLLLESQGQPVDLTTLTDSEEAFVMARPNYQSICKNNKRLTEMTLKVSMLNHRAHKLNQRFITQMEKRLSKITKTIMEMSES